MRIGGQKVAEWFRPAMLAAMLVALSAVTLTAQGQSRGRSWKRGPLRADDFTAAAPAVDPANSHLEYDITYSLNGVDEGLNTYLYCRGAALVYPRQSWLADGHNDEVELVYNQAIFDLVEIYRRHMERNAFLMKKRYQYNPLLEETLTQLNREVEALQAATDYGRDSVVLERIRRKNRRWLNEHAGGRPEFESRPFWWLLGMEAGMAFNTGSLNDLVQPSIGVTSFLAGFGWGRHGIYFRSQNVTTLARDSAYSFSGRLELPVMQRSDFSLLCYGFTLFDKPSYNIVPYLSFGLTNIVSDMAWYDGVNYTFGIMGRYHFHHWHTIKDGAKGKARCFTPSAMANLYVSYVNLDYEGRGLTIGMQLGITFGVRREWVGWVDEE